MLSVVYKTGWRLDLAWCVCHRRALLSLGALAVAGSCLAAPIRNVILCIGDGMGPGQVAAAHCFAGTNLVFETFPFQSLATTVSAEGEVTDSAAAATALSTGYKVYNGVVCLALPGSGRELETMVETFKKLDKGTGLVTTSYLTDATPAGFGAHAYNRYADEAVIAYDYLWRTRPNVLFGGGSYELDMGEVLAAGYEVATDAASLLALRGSRAEHVAGLFGYGPLPFVYDGLYDLPSLSQMTEVALGILGRDPDGFFLMVEGGLIDHACHGNDVERCVTETLAFNEAVKSAAAWAANRTDTLVIVTADHETGGLAVVTDNGAGVLPEVSWETGEHTAAPVAIYAWGVNAALVTNVVDNTQVRGVMCSSALMPATGMGIAWTAGLRFQTRWAVNSGDVCRVEYSPSLTRPAWQACGTVTAATTRVAFEATNATPNAQGFFRLITEPPGLP